MQSGLDKVPPVTPEKKRKPRSKKKSRKENSIVKEKPVASERRKRKVSIEVVIDSPVKDRNNSKRKGKQNASSDQDEHGVEGPGTEVGDGITEDSTSSRHRTAGTALAADNDLTPPPDSDEDELLLLPNRRSSKGQRRRPLKANKGKQKANEEVNNVSTAGKGPSGTRRAVILSDAEEELEDLARKTPTKKGVKGNTNRRKNQIIDEPATEVDKDEGVSKTDSRLTEAETPAQSKVISLYKPLFALSSELSHQENVSPPSLRGPEADPGSSSPIKATPMPSSSLARRFTFSRPAKPTPMQELIRRAASHPNSPFSSSPVHSPLVKATKSALRRIAPLHPNRRTPPPPPPPPPPPKKSKKMIQLEEKWEMELEESVEGWWALGEEERKEWRRAKRDKELGIDD